MGFFSGIVIMLNLCIWCVIHWFRCTDRCLAVTNSCFSQFCVKCHNTQHLKTLLLFVFFGSPIFVVVFCWKIEFSSFLMRSYRYILKVCGALCLIDTHNVVLALNNACLGSILGYGVLTIKSLWLFKRWTFAMCVSHLGNLNTIISMVYIYSVKWLNWNHQDKKISVRQALWFRVCSEFRGFVLKLKKHVCLT